MAIIQQVTNGELVDASASTTSLSSSTSTSQAGGSLDKDAFLQLLVAQMQYQDPLEPTDNTEYISQLATFSQLEETQNLNTTMSENGAYNLVGKQVIIKVTNSTTGETSYDSGMVDYVMRENGKVYLSVNDSLYSIDDLDTVADSDYYTATMLAKTFTNTVGALPTVSTLTLSDETKLTEARKTYDDMTDYQKSFVSTDTLTTLEKLEAKLKELKNAASSSDSSKDETEESGSTT